MSPEPFVTADEVAQHLKITRRQVLQMVRKGVLPGHPLCGSGRRIWRFKLSEVDQAILSGSARSLVTKPQSQRATCNTLSIGSPRSQKGQSNG
jgi:excisionase family DNA binding protein